ncbi:DUF5686 family protein [Cytophagaceae bacterium ABcell3]|nr:DUF5686 family protein [Cytophagaceae bacterium ABcell3]
MKKHLYLYILHLSFFLLLITPCFSQTEGFYKFSGQVTDDSTHLGFPFVLVEVNQGEKYQFSDIEGRFEITSPSPIHKLKFIHPGAKQHVALSTDTLTDSINLVLQKVRFPDNLTSTPDDARKLIEKVLKNRKRNNPAKQTWESSIYSKYTVSATDIPAPPDSSILNKIISFFSIPLRGRKKESLFLVESASKKKHLNRQNQFEKITGAKSTGLDVPMLYSYVIPLQYTTVYDKFINIGSDEYISPLTGNPFRRYAFEILYTLKQNDDTTYIVRFNPLPRKSIQEVKGFLYISAADYSIKYFLATDAIEGALYLELAQQYKKVDKITVPDVTVTTAILKQNRRPSPMLLTVQGKTWYDTKVPEVRFKKRDFTEVVRAYEPGVTKQPEEFWEKHRREPLTHEEQEAYKAYDSLGRDKKIQTLLRLGERIHFGYVPLGKVNFDLNRFINYNEAEGTRLGLGFHTNEHFSRNYFLRMHGGYGLRDGRFKYGIDGSYFLNGNPDNHVSFMYGRDLTEAGAVEFPYDLPQYNSERLRNMQLEIMDMSRTVQFAVGRSLFRNMQGQVALSQTRAQPVYDYAFRDHEGTFNFTELKAGFRFAPGAQYFRVSGQKIPAGSEYPVFWFLYTRGIDNFLNGEYGFSKYDVKIQQTFRTARFGTTGIQLLGGITVGDAPYSRLWNGRGALKVPSIVIHNSFETMRYNEFLSDRFVALFLSHNFGKIFSNDPNFRPELVLSHNMGIGWLRTPEDHSGIDFKTMEKGYLESGFFLNKLIVANIAGAKAGLGFGMFFRYGPYANRHLQNNMFFKMALLLYV